MGSATIEGTTYRKEAVIFSHEDDQPVFGEIKELLVTSTQECLFLLSQLVTSHFDTHFHAYAVIHGGHRTMVCTHAQLLDYHSMHILKHFGDCRHLFVCVKCKVIFK